MDDVEDGLLSFTTQLKVFRWEMMVDSIPKGNLAWVHIFYVILFIVEWLVPLPTIMIREINIPIDVTTINKVLGVLNPSSETFEAKI